MKVKILCKSERETLKKAREILRQANRHVMKLEKIREWCDENKNKDKGGKKWKAATAALYDFYDEATSVGIDIFEDGVVLKSSAKKG